MSAPSERPEEVPRIGESLDAIRRELDLGAPAEIDALVGGWGQLVGPALAAHSRPQSVRGGVLVVLADSPAWAGQLRYLDQVLVARIADELPAVAVREVRIAVARDSGAGG